MEQISRKKKYKAVDAATTINNIRNILYENGIIIKDSHHENGGAGTYSCTINIVNEELSYLGLGTNGKGMTFQYSLASAYAEFMERLQNDSILKNNYVHYQNNKEILKSFQIHPDEFFLDKEDLINTCFEILAKMLDKKNKEDVMLSIDYMKIFDEKNNKIVGLPYLNLIKKVIQILPVGIIKSFSGSNGMCAGNNKKEALIQGISEIFERYATRKIFFENIEIPTIPKEYFKGNTIYDLLTLIENNNNFSVIIKDISCGIGLPVIGLLIIDRNSQKYHFHIGADPSIITALERCLTEIYQGPKEIIIKYKFTDIEELDYFTDPLTNEIDINKLQQEFSLTLKNGTGKWPKYIFEDNSNFKRIYKNESNNDDDDLLYLLKVISENGFELFVRDVSTFGFPALHVVIPGMSNVQIINREKRTRLFNEFARQLRTILNLKEASDDEIKKVAFSLHSIYQLDEKSRPDIFCYYAFINNKDLNSLTTELFLVMLFYRINELTLAIYYINKHLERNEFKGKDNYLYCAKEYMKNKKKKQNDSENKKNLEILFDKRLVSTVFEDFIDPEKIFDHHPFPTCFECNKCNLKQDCKNITWGSFLDKIKSKKESSNIVQEKLLNELI